ncbi:hypothetical protein NDU88_002890 [Pleurodeles waltl]|uniref:Uncharacterized protein n=1 Tax=Pleurodeles waltl TaxID=8319 RepID=A0AAV7T3E2_PLEWA|nr:hypothetical protein NDU88_002890 [Pleurodeles waltl]
MHGVHLLEPARTLNPFCQQCDPPMCHTYIELRVSEMWSINVAHTSRVPTVWPLCPAHAHRYRTAWPSSETPACAVLTHSVSLVPLVRPCVCGSGRGSHLRVTLLQDTLQTLPAGNAAGDMSSEHESEQGALVV